MTFQSCPRPFCPLCFTSLSHALGIPSNGLSSKLPQTYSQLKTPPPYFNGKTGSHWPHPWIHFKNLMDTFCSWTLFWIQEVIPFLFLIKKNHLCGFFCCCFFQRCESSFIWGQNDDCILGDRTSDSSEKLMWTIFFFKSFI